ncbi:MAG: DGQHR domain-containing protein [Alphaproteobacteria bacterium]|uniref:DGQHR domain-containing protein n=1 Tax=Reichenbachiella sp. TaxID=2184521 RepID=UPI003267C87A
MAIAAKKKKKRKPKLTAEEKKQKNIQSSHKKMVRGVFRLTGFKRIPGLADKEFSFKGQATDFDDVFVNENILVCLEYTTTTNVGAHLKPKNIIYEKIHTDPAGFCQFLCDLNEDLKFELLSKYNSAEVIVKIVYCSLNAVDASLKENVPNPKYLDYAELRYFANLTDCTKKTAQYELFDFLEISPTLIGAGGKIGVASELENYNGFLLPESNSNFNKGFNVVSFYVDPDALLKRSYVLRKDGWKDSHNLYQRMISKPKIEAIRKHLRVNKRVFVNNIIATLPYDTKIVNEKQETVDPATITKTQPVTIQLPRRSNSVGLIDGQHRTYSYYEAVNDDAEIAKLRVKQNLLVTGIIYPKGISDAEKEKFEARLFLEINSTQTNAKSNLKQAIGLVLEPFSAESIATRVIGELDRGSGPLNGRVERYWFDKNKLKTTSIVSYGLKPLVKTSGDDSLFHLWDDAQKEKMVETEDSTALTKYVEFCVQEINKLLIAVKMTSKPGSWTTDKNVEGRMLTTTNINAILICLRLLIENGKTAEVDDYKASLSDLKFFKFKDYHSSQYNRMAEAIYQKYFN